MEARIAEVLSEVTHLSSMNAVWGFLLAPAVDFTETEFEWDVQLPPQHRRNPRKVVGVVHRRPARWNGLALTESELDAIYVETGDD